jgi:hypothetical protein
MAANRTSPAAAALWREILHLPAAEQFALYRKLRDFLAQGVGVGRGVSVENPTTTQLDRKAKALECVCQALAEHRKRSGNRLTVAGYDELAEELGLDLSSSQLLRSWRWRVALDAAEGRQIADSLRQEITRQARKSQGEDRHEKIEMVRRFLATKPPRRWVGDYSLWASKQNAFKRPQDPWLKSGSDLTRTLGGLRWQEICLIANGGQVELSRDPGDYGDLLEETEIQRIIGPEDRPGARYVVDEHSLDRLPPGAIVKRRSFPLPAARPRGVRVWLTADVIAYRDGEAWPERGELAFEAELVASDELEKRLGISHDTLRARVANHRWWLIPKPCARLRRAGAVWWRTDLEAWFAEADRAHTGRRSKTSENSSTK